MERDMKEFANEIMQAMAKQHFGINYAGHPQCKRMQADEAYRRSELAKLSLKWLLTTSFFDDMPDWQTKVENKLLTYETRTGAEDDT